MISTWIKVYFLVVMNLDNGLQVNSDNFPCSCYTFDGTLKPWLEGGQECRTQGGNLVSMETVEEWEFIKTQIQNRTTERDGHNEWWIGLEKRDGKWKWLSNHTLTYNKWQPGEPSEDYGEKCVLIAKNYPPNTYGLLNNAKCRLGRGWICEYKIKGIKETSCNETQVKWCGNETMSKVINESTTDQGTTTTTPDHKSKPTFLWTTVKQSTSKATILMIHRNVTVSSTRTSSDEERTASSEYLIQTTTQYKKDKQIPTTVKTVGGVPTTGVSAPSSKKPFPTLTIIITILVVGVVVFVCCVVLCVCGWKLKRKEKPKPRLKHDETNTEHNTSDVIAGSSSSLPMNEHELKSIVVQPNITCAQEDSHARTHTNASDNGTKEVAKSSQGCLVPQMIHNAVPDNHISMLPLDPTDKESNQNKDAHRKCPEEHMDLTPDNTIVQENTKKTADIYATVNKSKEKNKTTEVVYAEVKKWTKSQADQHKELVTYAELAEFNHDATRSVPKAPPPYHPTEYASVSTMSVRCQTK